MPQRLVDALQLRFYYVQCVVAACSGGRLNLPFVWHLSFGISASLCYAPALCYGCVFLNFLQGSTLEDVSKLFLYICNVV